MKGATFTELEVTQLDDGRWLAQCVVDGVPFFVDRLFTPLWVWLSGSAYGGIWLSL